MTKYFTTGYLTTCVKCYFLLLTFFLIVASPLSVSPGYTEDCSDGCVKILAFRCDRPGHKAHGQNFCCDCINAIGTKFGGALNRCETKCGRPWGVCKKVSQEELPEVLSRKFGYSITFHAVGEPKVSELEKDYKRKGPYKVTVPYTEKSREGTWSAKNKYKVTIIEYGWTFPPGDTFLAAEQGNIYVKKCHATLNITVVVSYSEKEFIKNLIARSAVNETFREELLKMPGTPIDFSL